MKDNFEQQLAHLKVKQPSSDYNAKVNMLLNKISSEQKGFNWSFIWAMGLLLSLGLNIYLYANTSSSVLQNNHTKLIAKNSTAQKLTHRHSIKQGAMIPYDGNNDVIIILEN